MSQKLCLIGFGTVGRGLVEILQDKRGVLRDQFDYEPIVVAVSDVFHGSCYDPDGLDLDRVLDLIGRNGSEPGALTGYSDNACEWDSLETIRKCGSDAMVEVTLTNIETGEPALSHCQAALEAGAHVVTTNKGPVALAWRDLSQMASSRGLQFRFEGTVMSGTPVLSTATESLAGCEFSRIRGILNGTTNYILSEMEQGRPYDEALLTAQELGYAEADPTADVEGYDVVAKVVILANVVMGADLSVSQVVREGITGLDAGSVSSAPGRGGRWKLIGQVERVGGDVVASVAPVELPMDDPLSSVGGVTNAVTLESDLVGPVTIVGAGAGKEATGMALLSDLVAIHRAG
ncbi:MAG: homoserine dehydrogenase [Planctomycetota bacterium]|nr:homoserine dehydrogenase [Planctomycetota bacterium]